MGLSTARPAGSSGGGGFALRAGGAAVVVGADVDVAVGGDLGLATRVDAVAGGRTHTGGAWVCMTGSCDVGMLSVGVELAAGVAGCVGTVLAAVGAVCAVGGGGLAAAGPVRVGSVSCVDDAAVDDLGAEEDMRIDGSG